MKNECIIPTTKNICCKSSKIDKFYIIDNNSIESIEVLFNGKTYLCDVDFNIISDNKENINIYSGIINKINYKNKKNN